jgi:hypothetical protein
MARVRLFGRLAAEGLSRIRQSWNLSAQLRRRVPTEVAQVMNEMGTGIEGWCAPRYLTPI